MERTDQPPGDQPYAEPEGAGTLVAERFNNLMDSMAFPVVVSGMFLIVKLNHHQNDEVDACVMVIDGKKTAVKYSLHVNTAWVRFSSVYQGVISSVEKSTPEGDNKSFNDFRRSMEGSFISQLNRYKADMRHDVTGVSYADDELCVTAQTPSTRTADSSKLKEMTTEEKRKLYERKVRKTLKHNKLKASITHEDDDELVVSIPSLSRVIHINCMHITTNNGNNGDGRDNPEINDQEPMKRGKDTGSSSGVISTIFLIVEYNLIVCVCTELRELLKSLKFILLKSQSTKQEVNNKDDSVHVDLSEKKVGERKDDTEENNGSANDAQVATSVSKLVPGNHDINNKLEPPGGLDSGHSSPAYVVPEPKLKGDDVRISFMEKLKAKLKDKYEIRAIEFKDHETYEIQLMGFTGSIYKTLIDLSLNENETKKYEKLTLKIMDPKDELVPKPLRLSLSDGTKGDDEIISRILKYVQKKICPSTCFETIYPDKIYIMLDTFFVNLRKAGKIVNHEIEIREKIRKENMNEENGKQTDGNTVPILKFIIKIHLLHNAPSVTLALSIKKMNGEMFQSTIKSNDPTIPVPQACGFSIQVVGSFTSYALSVISSTENLEEGIKKMLPMTLMQNNIYVTMFTNTVLPQKITLPTGSDIEKKPENGSDEKYKTTPKQAPESSYKMIVVDRVCDSKKKAHTIEIDINESSLSVDVRVDGTHEKSFDFKGSKMPAQISEIANMISDAIRSGSK